MIIYVKVKIRATITQNLIKINQYPDSIYCLLTGWSLCGFRNFVLSMVTFGACTHCTVTVHFSSWNYSNRFAKICWLHLSKLDGILFPVYKLWVVALLLIWADLYILIMAELMWQMSKVGGNKLIFYLMMIVTKQLLKKTMHNNRMINSRTFRFAFSVYI